MEAVKWALAVMDEIKKAVKGKDMIIEKVLTAVLAKGHILIEDIPGVGKTTLALAFSKALALDYNRMQFTPDVLPTDVVGFSVLRPDGGFEYKPGTVLCNLFLADEINRTSSKTQSALLEVMEEGKVTVDGVTREVPKPFVVIATQNPVGSIGTQQLPESQLDRFMVRLTMGYPEPEEEVNLLKERQSGSPLAAVACVGDEKMLLQMQEQAEKVYIHDRIYEYITQLAGKTRKLPALQLGLSPRGTIALTEMSKARACLKGRDYLMPEDVQAVFPDVAVHRLLLSPKARVNQTTAETVIEDILKSVPLPKIAG